MKGNKEMIENNSMNENGKIIKTIEASLGWFNDKIDSYRKILKKAKNDQQTVVDIKVLSNY